MFLLRDSWKRLRLGLETDGFRPKQVHGKKKDCMNSKGPTITVVPSLRTYGNESMFIK